MRPRGTVSLERALSKLGAASRSEARRLIESGQVSVNGRPAANPLAVVRPERDDIRVRGARAARTAWRTIAFHKPRGTLTTRRDPEGRRTIYDVLGDAAAGLVPVGRLDFASTGLLLLTNDTQLLDRLTDPQHGVAREYVVTVRGAVSDDAVASMVQGIGDLRASRVTVRKRSRRETHLLVELREGGNREVRRLFAAAGHEVTRLLRISFGPIQLQDLQPGEWRELARDAFRRRVPDAGR